MSQKIGMWLDQILLIGSEIGIAVFTAVVALVELARFFQGPKITLSVQAVMQATVKPAFLVPPRYYNRSELAIFPEFPVVFSNNGPRGGVVTYVEIALIKPSSEFPKVIDGKPSKDTLDVEWSMEGSFSSGRPGALSMKDFESKALMTSLKLSIKDENPQQRDPTKTFDDLQRDYPYFEFELRYRSTSGRKGKEVVKKKSFKIRLTFQTAWTDSG
jgi:hypothetical protein